MEPVSHLIVLQTLSAQCRVEFAMSLVLQSQVFVREWIYYTNTLSTQMSVVWKPSQLPRERDLSSALVVFSPWVLLQQCSAMGSSPT